MKKTQHWREGKREQAWKLEKKKVAEVASTISLAQVSFETFSIRNCLPFMCDPSQFRATYSTNAEVYSLYHSPGHMVLEEVLLLENKLL